MAARNTPPELTVIQNPEVEKEQVQTIDNLDDAISFITPVLKEIWEIIQELGIFPQSSEIAGWTSLYKLADEETFPETLSDLAKMLGDIKGFVLDLKSHRLKDYAPRIESLKQQLKESVAVIQTIVKKNPYSKKVARILQRDEE